jgi:hypothetical protein
LVTGEVAAVGFTVDEPLGEVEVEPVVGVEKLPTAVVQPGAFFLGDCLA